MAAPSPPAGLDGAIRDTDEYAAAFDLEVWKAQQQLRYQAQLRQAKESLERRLRTQMRQSEQQKLAELEGLRSELETMGRRLQGAEESLVRRAAQLDAREAAFQAKRVKVAEQHESYVARVEERERRTREEAQLTQSTLHARLQEKDEVIAQLQGRLSAAQQEYELLRRRAARHLTEQTDTEGQRVRELEGAVALAQAQLTETQRQLREKTAEAERAAEDRVRLQGQLREVTEQLSLVRRKYHKLTEASQTREWERLRREQDALEAARRAQTRQLVEENVRGTSALSRPPAATHPTPLPPQLASSATLQPQKMSASAERRAGGRDEFYDMLSALKAEVTAGLAAAAAKDGSRNVVHSHLNHTDGEQTRSLPFKIVERPSSRASYEEKRPHDGGAGLKGAAPATGAVASPDAAAAVTTPKPRSPPSVADLDDLESMQYAESEIPRDETSSVSAALSAIQGVQTSASPSPAHPTARHAESREEKNIDVVVDMGDTSMESYQYPRAELPSWADSHEVNVGYANSSKHESNLREGSRKDFCEVDGQTVAPLLPPPARAGTLPPLAPELRGLFAEDEESHPSRHSPHHSHAGVSPTPHDFVLAREAPQTDATAKTQAARRDMVSFVQQLKMNREKLLETGVYTEQDTVVREMGEKIRMYEDYLAQHS